MRVRVVHTCARPYERIRCWMKDGIKEGLVFPGVSAAESRCVSICSAPTTSPSVRHAWIWARCARGLTMSQLFAEGGMLKGNHRHRGPTFDIFNRAMNQKEMTNMWG